MAQFLTTTATNYQLEELVKNARQFLVLISPYIKVNSRLRELLADRARCGLDIRLIYGKKHQPRELAWLHELGSVKVKFCPNLHAKCYLNEQYCIITSLNLYDFSQVNNNEMGVLISHEGDAELYQAVFKESKRLLRISQAATPSVQEEKNAAEVQRGQDEDSDGKLSTSKLGRKLGITKSTFESYLVEIGYLEVRDGEYRLTSEGKRIGGERRRSSRFGTYFLWPEAAFEKPTI